MSEISVIVPCWNRRDELLACLGSLYRQESVSLECIVVDDGSDDGTAAAVRTAFPQVLVSGDAGRKGPYVRRNEGARLAQAAVLLFIDSDVEFQDARLLRRVLDVLSAHPRIGALGGEFPIHDRARANGHRLSRGFYPYRVYPVGDALLDCDYLPTCFCCVRRDVFEAIGGFDAGYAFGPADADLGLQLRRRGFRVCVKADCAVFHNAAPAGRRPDATERYIQGRIRYIAVNYTLARLGLQYLWDMLQITRRAWRGDGPIAGMPVPELRAAFARAYRQGLRARRAHRPGAEGGRGGFGRLVGALGAILTMHTETFERLKSPGPTGLVPVVKEVEWGRAQPPSTLASTGTRPVGGKKL